VTKLEPLTTRETVALETPQSLAISRMLTVMETSIKEEVKLIVRPSSLDGYGFGGKISSKKVLDSVCKQVIDFCSECENAEM
jgi:hypothetical protein